MLAAHIVEPIFARQLMMPFVQIRLDRRQCVVGSVGEQLADLSGTLCLAGIWMLMTVLLLDTL
jgi:hypothetical protein